MSTKGNSRARRRKRKQSSSKWRTQTSNGFVGNLSVKRELSRTTVRRNQSRSPHLMPLRQSPRLALKNSPRNRQQEDPSPPETISQSPFTRSQSSKIQHISNVVSLVSRLGSDLLTESAAPKRRNGTCKGHQWTIDELEVLCVLKFRLHLAPHDIAIILNAKFADALVPFKPGMCSTYLSHLGRRDRTVTKGRSIWETISKAGNGEIPIKYRLMVESLQDLVYTLGIAPTLQPQSNYVQRSSHRRGMKRKSRLRQVRPTAYSLPLLSPFEEVNQAEEVSIEVKIERPPTPDQIFDASIEPPNATIHRRIAVEVQIHSSITYSGYSLQFPRMLYRAYSESSAGLNGPNGFKAGSFSTLPNRVSVLPPWESSSEDFLKEALNHLRKVKATTRLISVTSSLIWAVYLAIRRTARPHFSFISGAELDLMTKIYPVPPILKELRRRKWLPKTYNYDAAFEYLIWGEIRQPAIVRDWPISDLNDFARQSNDVCRFLRLDTLKNAILQVYLRDSFFREPLALDASVGRALGQLLHFFGITPATDEDVVYELLYGLLQGWLVHISHDQSSRDSALYAFRSAFEVGESLPSYYTAAKLTRAFEKAVVHADEEVQAERQQWAFKGLGKYRPVAK